MEERRKLAVALAATNTGMTLEHARSVNHLYSLFVQGIFEGQVVGPWPDPENGEWAELEALAESLAEDEIAHWERTLAETDELPPCWERVREWVEGVSDGR